MQMTVPFGRAAMVPAAGDLPGFIKMGQKQSQAFKVAWQTFCGAYGGGINDPNRHDASYISGFADYLGQLAQADLGAQAAQAGFPMPGFGGGMSMGKGMGKGMGKKRPADGGMGMGGAPPQKKAAPVSSGDPEKDTLVTRVKELQRRDASLKQAWWTFCDEQLGGVKDPNKHEKEILQEFLTTHEG